MYLAELVIENFRCFGEGENRLTLPLGPGLTVLVGENDTGKTAVIDAIRIVLGTRDQDYLRLEDRDFHWAPGTSAPSTEIRIRCKFDALTLQDKGAFAEYLTYVQRDGQTDAVLYITWTAKSVLSEQSARWRVSVQVRSGENAEGPMLDSEARNLLRTTYLRPLRDAEKAMSAGRGSRLSQILQHTKEVRESGEDYDPVINPHPDPATLSVLGVGDYANALLATRKGIEEARKRLNQTYLKPLALAGDALVGRISVGALGGKDVRLRQLLEKLELELVNQDSEAPANRGLGSNNLMFMACELLLLGTEAADFPLLLIEEPEAHLHPQRQIRLMQFLQEQAGQERLDGQKVQIVMTTHSPNLASVIKLDNLVMLQRGKAFPLKPGQTQLEETDYRFLERFLDVTKANLFFARGVVIVEGDGENILLPTLARLIERDFSQHGVSVVNVGHTGLRRFSRIFQRRNVERDGVISVPVACITDLDVMPDCAPAIIGKVDVGQDLPDRGTRQWRVKGDFTEEELAERRKAISRKADGQLVRTFVADEWTLEYDLAYAGMAEDVWVAAHLAKRDDQINEGTVSRVTVEAESAESFNQLIESCATTEELASNVYALFTRGATASKAVAAQYLAERLTHKAMSGGLTSDQLRSRLPRYLVEAIDYVTRSSDPGAIIGGEEEQGDA